MDDDGTGHVHRWADKRYVDFCHYTVVAKTCEGCGEVNEAHVERSFDLNPPQIAFADQRCHRCRELLAGKRAAELGGGRMSATIVIPGTGVIVALDAEPQEIAQAWDELLVFEQQIKSTKREIADEITRRLDHEGRRSLTIDGVKFETTAPTEKQWDLKELQLTLVELVEEGTISQAKADRCVKWEPKPVWMELKALLSDPRCRARVEHCFHEAPAPRYARISR